MEKYSQLGNNKLHIVKRQSHLTGTKFNIAEAV